MLYKVISETDKHKFDSEINQFAKDNGIIEVQFSTSSCCNSLNIVVTTYTALIGYDTAFKNCSNEWRD